MRIKRKIQLLVILVVVIVVGLVAINISAHNTTNQRRQYQKDTSCLNNSDCPKLYCNSEIKSSWNSQVQSCCR